MRDVRALAIADAAVIKRPCILPAATCRHARPDARHNGRGAVLGACLSSMHRIFPQHLSGWKGTSAPTSESLPIVAGTYKVQQRLIVAVVITGT